MKESTFDYAEDVISRAMMFAISAHSGQYRKAQRTPAIIHAMEACVIVSTLTLDEEVMAAAILHDTVEDTDVTPEQIRQMFSPKISALVASETENKRPELSASDTWMIRKEESLRELKESTDINVKYLWLGDKLSNMRSFYQLYLKKGDDMWQMFNCKDKKKHEWYYRTIAELLSELSDTVAYKEYVKLTDLVFGKDQ